MDSFILSLNIWNSIFIKKTVNFDIKTHKW